ncbi:LysE family translocator [Psychroflexus planctonicus]|uniref:Lysine transporter LysE n=1 Tax=Psychroflexus planctonicus TaxID=1526575 RepID=A0ABQ1SJE1_9FLAO|nr:LysE family transporter [Psychroflexus planctonicus]GGE36971.1 lysine transporter LysE [Psychroflexus planctonicus]
METTKLFFFTFFAAAAGVIPPGLINMSVVKTSLSEGKRNGLIMAIGASFVVFFQALVAILMSRYISTNPSVRVILLRLGLVILIILSIYFFVKSRLKQKPIQHKKFKSKKSFFKGVGMSIINIFPIPFFVVISTLFNTDAKADYDAWSIFFFSLAAALGTFATLYLYIFSFIRIGIDRRLFAKRSNLFMAILMLILIAVTSIRIYYE